MWESGIVLNIGQLIRAISRKFLPNYAHSGTPWHYPFFKMSPMWKINSRLTPDTIKTRSTTQRQSVVPPSHLHYTNLIHARPRRLAFSRPCRTGVPRAPHTLNYVELNCNFAREPARSLAPETSALSSAACLHSVTFPCPAGGQSLFTFPLATMVAFFFVLRKFIFWIF